MRYRVYALLISLFVFARAPSCAAQIQFYFQGSIYNASIENLHEVAANPTVAADARATALKSVVSVVTERYNALVGFHVLNVMGSGFVVEKNLVLLSAHEVMVGIGSAYFFDERHSKFFVLTEKGKFSAKVEFVNACEDLAILRVEDGQGFDKEPVSFEAADLNAEPNDPWFAFGFPDAYNLMRVAKFDLLNGTRRFSFGGNCRSVEWGLIGETKPGYSGSPIVNKSGRVVGLIMGAPDELSLNSFFVTVPRMLDFLKYFKDNFPQDKNAEPKEG